jgi:hypothetical protein
MRACSCTLIVADRQSSTSGGTCASHDGRL